MTTVFLAHTDCGFSMRWEPSKDTEECPEFSPASMRETWTDPEKEVLEGFVSVIQVTENSLEHRGVDFIHIT